MHLNELNRLEAVGDSKASASRMWSRGVWQDCPYHELRTGTKDGFTFHDDFLGNYVQAANVAAASTTLGDPYAAFTNATAGATIASGVSPTDACGSIVLATATVSEGVTMGVHTAKNTAAYIDALSATNRFWAEIRIKTLNVAANRVGFYFGLGQVGRLITLGLQASTSATAAIDHIGFHKAATGTTAVQTVSGNGTATAVNATAGVVAADTYTRLGMYWNGPGNTFTWYQDGVALTTQYTLTSTQFPAGASLALYLSILGGSSASGELVTADWIRYAFERVG